MDVRYKVETALFQVRRGLEIERSIIVDNGIPDTVVNAVLMDNKYTDFDKRENTGELYLWCDFVNWVYDYLGKEYRDVSLNEIQNYLDDLYYNQDVSYTALSKRINVISKVYELLAAKNEVLDQSLYIPTKEILIRPNKRGKSSGRKVLVIHRLQTLYRPDEHSKYKHSMPEYTKWYTPQEVNAIAKQLRLDYACVFLVSVHTGFRISSILSVRLWDVDLQNGTITPTTSKTRKVHAAALPPFLVQLLTIYITRMRMQYESTSDYLFLGKSGEPMTYYAYRKALNAAGAKIGIKDPLHTHAGRSTYLKNLRTLQFEQQRTHQPAITDAELCALMDWKNLQCLDDYDVQTRAQAAAPLATKIHDMISDADDILNYFMGEPDEH